MDELTVRRLTKRETNALILVSEGKSDKEIARAQHCAQSTVAARMRNIYFKLHARNRTEAVSIGYKMGLLHCITIALLLISYFQANDDLARPRSPSRSGRIVRITRHGRKESV